VSLLQAEKKVKELQGELDDLSQRLDEAGGATQAQVRQLIMKSNTDRGRVCAVMSLLVNKYSTHLATYPIYCI